MGNSYEENASEKIMNIMEESITSVRNILLSAYGAGISGKEDCPQYLSLSIEDILYSVFHAGLLEKMETGPLPEDAQILFLPADLTEIAEMSQKLCLS